MKVILKPLSHPAVGEIVIVDALYAVGRDELPFASLPASAVGQLSKRHARIFQETGNTYIVDLGSLNGTLVNEQQLQKDAVLLHTGDLVTFGALRFQVQLEQELAKPSSAEVPLRLMLLPVAAPGEMEPLVIESFPFLIARVDDVFGHYHDRFPDDLRKISRRHAVITRRGEEVCIEDLDSANGTFVCGERLDERARVLSDDDTVSFGSDRFTYKVAIERVAVQIDESALALTLLKPIEAQLTGTDKTRFVSSATSFLDVFCVDDKPAGEAKPADIAATAAVKVLEVSATPLAKVRAVIAQMWTALMGRSGMDRRVMLGVVGAITLVVVAASASWLLGGGKREIKELLDSGSYAASAVAANRYLEDKPADYEAESWGEEALAKAVVPAWLELIEARKFDAAARLVSERKDEYRFIKRGQDMLDTLSWSGRVEAHLADRGGINAPVVMFRHEDIIESLVDEWDTDSSRHQQLIGQIATYEPAFEPIHLRMFSILRTLRNDNAIYVKAIARLKDDVGKALAEGNRTRLNIVMSEFASNYPRVRGIDKLQADAAKFETLSRHVEQRQIVEVLQMNRTVQFETPIFAQHVRKWLAAALPPPDVVAGYESAAQAWSRGDRDRAIEILKPLTGAPWGSVATRQIERYQRVAAEYGEVKAARGNKDYWDRLVNFSATLQPGEDQHLLRAVQPDLLVHKETLVTQLSASLRRTQSLWDAYQDANGIPGVVRVEERITDRFKSQAQRLSAASAEVIRSDRTYRLLQLEQPAGWKTLSAAVLSEVRRQRRWLQDLNIILEPSLLQAKLNLLPELPESTP